MHLEGSAHLCQFCNNLRTAWYEKVHFMIRIGDSLFLPSCKGQNRRAGDTEESQGGDIVYF